MFGLPQGIVRQTVSRVNAASELKEEMQDEVVTPFAWNTYSTECAWAHW